MRYGFLVLSLTLAWVLPTQAALLDSSVYDASQFLPPPPAGDSARTQEELAELRALAATTSVERKAAAARDAKDETPDIFNGAIGFDIATRPQTQKLLQMVADEEEVDSKVAKTFFHRPRPYVVDETLATCETKKPGKPANSYPSGHATLAFSMGVVLAHLMPAKAQAILARSSDYAENRLICAVHYRSDIVAGQQFGTVLAQKLMENAAFKTQMQAASAELAAHP
jgi:acid phosphatase (class A)